MYKSPAMREYDDNLKRIIELERQVEKYKADAELGQAVRKAFEDGDAFMYIDPIYDLNPEHLIIEKLEKEIVCCEGLLEWAKGVK